MTLEEQFEWWLRQRCEHYGECPYASEVPAFIHAVRAEIELLQSECHEYRKALRGLCTCEQFGPMTVCSTCKTLSYYDDPPEMTKDATP